MIARNYRCRRGEIDLVLADGDTLVFAEVRLRARSDFGGAAASIDHRKQSRIAFAARHYLATVARKDASRPCRFDAVLMDRLEPEAIEWIRDAFGV